MRSSSIMRPLEFVVSVALLLTFFHNPCQAGSLRIPGVVEFGLSRSSASSMQNPRSKLHRRDGTPQAAIDLANYVYFINVTVGTPGQTMSLALDMAGSETFIPWSQLSTCTDKANLCALYGAYDNASSATYENVSSDQFAITYTDGTKYTGDYINDTFRVADVELPRFILALATNYSSSNMVPISGIMGAGLGRGKSNQPSIMSQMKSQGVISTRALSVWLNDLESSQGSVLFGGIDRAKYSGSLVVLPLQNDTLTNTTDQFAVAFAYLAVTSKCGSVVYDNSNSFAVVFDQGATLTYLPNDLANAIGTGVGAVYDPEVGFTVDCDIANTQSQLQFQFGNNVDGPIITVDISEFVLPLLTSSGTKPKLSNGKTACLWGIASSGGFVNIIGTTFLRSAYVVYDIENRQIAVAQALFNVSTSSILQIVTSIPSATVTATGTAELTAVGNPTAVFAGINDAPLVIVATASGSVWDLGQGPTCTSASGTHKSGSGPTLSTPSPMLNVFVIAMFCAALGGSLLWDV